MERSFKRMIFIKSVEIEIVKNDKHVFNRYQSEAPLCSDGQAAPKAPILNEEETVYGQKFINENGQQVVIAASKEVQDTIGLPFASFDKIHKLNNDLKMKIVNQRIEILGYKAQMNRIEDMNFFKRLVFIFSKKKRLKMLRT